MPTAISMRAVITEIADFYLQGFRSMRLGKRLWVLVGIKLLIMFGVIKLLFFPDVLHERFADDTARSECVSKQLIQLPKE